MWITYLGFDPLGRARGQVKRLMIAVFDTNSIQTGGYLMLYSQQKLYDFQLYQ
jgi:hypothetical protein